MKVTPLDIRRKEFKRSMRGYADEEVDVFLDEVADEFERLFQENAEMHDRLERQEEQLEANAQIRTALEKTLVSAQLQADQMTANARKESELVMRDAELQARKIVSESYGETQKVQQALVQLKHLEEDFRFKFQSLLEAHLKLLNEATPLAVREAPAVEAAATVAVSTTEVGLVAPPDEREEVVQTPDVVAPTTDQTGSNLPWPEEDEPVKAQSAAGADEDEAGAAPPSSAATTAGDLDATDDVPTQETDLLDSGGLGASPSGADPDGPSEGKAESEGSPTAAPEAEEDDAQGRGFFFGKQMEDVDDSFVTFETLKKDSTRDFEW